MKSVLVSSLDEYSGKTGIIAALSLILRERGLKVGYFKPFSIGLAGTTGTVASTDSADSADSTDSTDRGGRRNDVRVVDEDAFRIAKILDEGSHEDLCPVILEIPYEDFVMSCDVHGIRERINEAFKRVSAGKDIVLVEGVLNFRVGRSIDLCDFCIAEMLNAEILMVVKYRDFVIDDILYASEHAGFKVLFNQVPVYKVPHMSVMRSFLERRDIRVVGAIPHDSMLSGLSVYEICEAVGGRFLVKPREDIVVEQLLIGAMTPQSAVTYFRRSRNAAVITGGDRSELHALALEMPSIKCIVLTGNLEPPAIIKGVAASKDKPLIITPDDTLTAVKKIDRAFGKTRLHSMVKIKRMQEFLLKHVRIDEII